MSLAGDNILNMNAVLEMNIHEIHIFLAHRIDRQKLEEQLRK